MANIDPQEIENFDKLSEEWWDANGPMKPLHQMNPTRLQFIQQQIELKDKKTLDVGCGGGLLSEAMAKSGANVTGIDQAKQLIAVAQQHAQQNDLNINYNVADIAEWCEQHKAEYDIVTCLELLEHVPDPSAIISDCAKALKPGGILVVSTINRNFKAYLMTIIGAEVILRWLPRGTHQYDKFITPAECMRWCLAQNLQPKQIKGLRYRPLKQDFVIDNSVAVNYIASVTKETESN